MGHPRWGWGQGRREHLQAARGKGAPCSHARTHLGVGAPTAGGNRKEPGHAVPLSGLGVPQEPSRPSVFPCTDSHCPPAIPRHTLFNNLSLLNYLLAFTTSPPTLPSTLTFRLFPQKQKMEPTAGNAETWCNL